MMALKSTLSLLLLFQLSQSVFGQYEKFLHKNYAERAKLFGDFWEKKTVNDNYDSTLFFNEVLAMRKLAIDNNDEGLEMDTYMSELSFFTYRKKYSQKTTLATLEKILKIAHDKKLLTEASVEKHFGSFYFVRVKNYELAFEHFLHMYEIIKDVNPLDFPDKINCINQLSQAYYYFGDYEKAIYYAKDALNGEQLYHSNNAVSSNLILVGKCFRDLKSLDSSDLYFNAAIKNSIAHKDTFWTAIASGNVGYNYYLRKDYEKAIPLLKIDINTSKNQNDWGRKAESLIALADIELKRKNIALAEQLLLQAKKTIVPTKKYERFLYLYPILTKLYILKGQPQQALMYFDSTNIVKDSLTRQFSALKMIRANQHTELQLHRAEIEEINDQKSMQLLVRNIVIVFILLTMIITLLLFSRRRLKEKNEQQLAENELNAAKEQMSAFTKSIQEKNDLIEKATIEIERINSEIDNRLPSPQKSLVVETNSLKILQESVILTEKDWRNFTQIFEKVHEGFFSHLKEKLPTLSAAEIRFISLTKIQLSNKEMASMLGVSTDAIRQMRSRLKKKLNLSEDESLEGIVDKI